MTYHKLFKKLKKLEKKNPEFCLMAINKHQVITTDKGQCYIRDNVVKIPRIYKLAKNIITTDTEFKKQILEIIGE